jgi:hypothetical protein
LSLRFQDISRVMPHLKYQAFLNYELHTKNVGRSPALNIQIFPELYILPFESDKFAAKVTAEEKRYCDSYDKRQDPGTIVFPDEPGTTYGGVGQPIYEDAVTPLSDHPNVRYIAAVLIGCVSYQFGASTRKHQTRFVYGIYHARGTLYFVEGQDVPADDLKLERLETNDYANQ